MQESNGTARLEDCISFLIGKAAQQVSRRARDALAPFGITPPQFAVLSALFERDGQSGAEIGARLVLDSATITGLIDRLEAAGLLERRPDPGGDRRVNRVFLTARGRALEEGLDRAVGELNRQVAAELGDQAPALWAALRRLGEVAAVEGKPEAARRRGGR